MFTFLFFSSIFIWNLDEWMQSYYGLFRWVNSFEPFVLSTAFQMKYNKQIHLFHIYRIFEKKKFDKEKGKKTLGPTKRSYVPYYWIKPFAQVIQLNQNQYSPARYVWFCFARQNEICHRNVWALRNKKTASFTSIWWLPPHEEKKVLHCRNSSSLQPTYYGYDPFSELQNILFSY